jgi:hypothetical protein
MHNEPLEKHQENPWGVYLSHRSRLWNRLEEADYEFLGNVTWKKRIKK